MDQKKLTQTQSSWRTLFSIKMFICVFTGFTSGLPLYVLISLIPTWLSMEKVSLADIGLFGLVQLPYTWKFIWSPAMDRYQMPFLGLRRGWMIVTQIILLIVIVQFGVMAPGGQPMWMIMVLGAAVAFFGATQDITLDAYRRELLDDDELGLGNAIHINAYRFSGLVPGALALWLATWLPWNMVFFITALFMSVGIVLTLCIKEQSTATPPSNLKDAVVKPFMEFLTRHGVKTALLVLAFMVLYKLGDSMATALSNPFYLAMGYSLNEIALVAKNATLWALIIGGMAGGMLMVKLGINKSLWVFGAVQMVTILGLYVLALIGHNIYALAAILCLEYFGVGMGTAALVAYLASISHPQFVATQIALLTALSAVPRIIASATTGVIVDSIGWPNFYLVCFVLALPGMLLLFWIAPWRGEKVFGQVTQDL